MSYLEKDTSIHDGAPIECYEFIANHNTWRYTSYHKPVTVDGSLYTPLPIARTAIEISSVIDSPSTMDFIIPSDHDIAADFCYTRNPRDLVVIVRRVHEGDDFATEFKIEWTGRFAGSSYSGKWATVKTASIIKTELNGFLSSVFYQKICNHVLFDSRCKVLRANFTEEADVTKIQGQIITVDDMVYSNDELVGGVMTNTRTGEEQSIITNDNNILRIGYPFFDLLVGDTVELTLGCDHLRLSDCKNTFNNTDNYGGFDFIPEINPFEKLVYTTSTKTEVSQNGTINYKPEILPDASAPGGPSSSSNTLAPSRRPRPSPTSSSNVQFGSSVASGSGNIPAAFLGQMVPAVIGQKRVPNHNLIWTGNLRPITETIVSSVSSEEIIDHGGGVTETITTTETVYTTSIVGYYIDMQLSLCLGPDVHLIGIYVNGSPIWQGDVGPARTEITLPESDTFLSDAKIYFSGGSYSQAPDPLIDTPDYPGYVGIATVLLKDIRADVVMGQLSFEVVRIPNPLALSDSVNKIGNDVNVMTAITEVITNEWGYGGLDINNIDTATFITMAGVLIGESNICSIKIDNEVGVAQVIAALQSQAQSVIFEDPEQALITGVLVRPEELDYGSMARFSERNIIELRNYEKNGWHDTIEQARGLYTERDAEYNEVPVFLQNAANISQSGRGKKTVTVSYPFVPNKSLARTLLGRDMGALAAPNYSFSLLTNRDGASRFPGEIISVTWYDAKLLNVPMEVISVRKQDIKSNNVVLKLHQIKFPATTGLFGEGGAVYDPGFDVDPTTPVGARIITAPYYMARSRNGITSQQVTPLNYPLFLPQPANSFQSSFDAYINNLPNTSSEVLVAENATYPTYGLLTASIDQYDGFATGELASITIDGVVNPQNLTDIGEAGVRNGRLFLFVGGEIMSFESAVDNGGGSWTLNDVHRALLDTVFESHADNAPVYIIGNNFTNVSQNGFAYPVGYTPSWSLVSNGVIIPGNLQDALITTAWAPSSLRTLRPPRPHNTKVDSVARSSTPVAVVEGNSVTVTWSTRSRVSSQVALMLDAAETAEINGSNSQLHRVFHRSSGGTVTEIGTMAYGGNSATFTMPNVTNGAGFIYVQAEITLGGVLYTSIAQDRVPVTVS